MEDIKNTIVQAHQHIAGTCISCGSLVTNKYCSVCGEKQVDAHDFALKHYLEESVEGFTHFDNNFFRSAKVLITQPGLLSQYFSAGKRINFLKPFQFFLICNLVFFLLVGKLNIFSVPLSSFYQYAPFTWFHTKQTILAKAHTAAQIETLSLAFNERVGTESKLFIACFIPFLALAIGLIFINCKRYLSEHLVFATHFFSFILLYYTAYTLLISIPFYWLSGNQYVSTFDAAGSMITLLIFGIYFTIAAKRFYKANTLHAAGGALFIIVVFTIGLYAYRLLLFYKVMHSIHLNALY
jgi:hypothetical protein